MCIIGWHRSASLMASVPFCRTIRPPGCASGRQYSSKTGMGATARAVTNWYFSRWSGSWPSSSARMVMVSVLCNCKVSKTSLQKLTFLPTESTRVSLSSGQMIFSGMPGKPAPVPKSTRLVGGAVLLQPFVTLSESKKCLKRISSGSRMAVRLNFVFHSSSVFKYISNCSNCQGLSSIPKSFSAAFCQVTIALLYPIKIYGFETPAEVKTDGKR